MDRHRRVSQRWLLDPSASGTRCYPWGSTTFDRCSGLLQDSRPTLDTFYNQDDPSIREEVLDSRLGVPCHVSFGFLSGFYGIRLTELRIDPQLESTIRPKARGLHSIWNVILRIAFSIWFLRQDNTTTIEDLQE
jgi:hypothetical protein